MPKNKQITVLEKKVNPLVSRAESFEIKNQRDMEEATKMLSEMNQIGDRIDAEKRKVLDPLNQAIKAERARWKPIETMYENGIQLLRQAMTKWQTEKTRIANEEAAKIAARVGSGKGKLKAETAIAQISEIDRPAATVATEVGAVKFRTVKKYEVVDIKKLPIEFHMPDDVAIKEAMRDGRELPGVRYYEEQVPVNFR
jgi:hypothetical protein